MIIQRNKEFSYQDPDYYKDKIPYRTGKQRLRSTLTGGITGAGLGGATGGFIGYGTNGKTLAGAGIGAAIGGSIGALSGFIGSSKSSIDAENMSREQYRQYLIDPEPTLAKKFEEERRDACKIKSGGPSREILKLIKTNIEFIPQMVKEYKATKETDNLERLIPEPVSSFVVNQDLINYKEGTTTGIKILEMGRNSGNFLYWFPDSEKPYGFITDDLDGDYRTIKGAIHSFYIGTREPLMRRYTSFINQKL